MRIYVSSYRNRKEEVDAVEGGSEEWERRFKTKTL